jgi:Holliday junction resolvase RusA-like endonuclease
VTATLFTPNTPAATAGPRPDPAIIITVYGEPGPQGSKKHLGNGVMVESSKKVKPWRQDVKYAAIGATARIPGWRPLDGPLAASIVFTFARRKGHYRTGRNAHLLRDSAPVRPAVYPDLSKILRSTEDALTGVVWADDQRVVEYLRLGKWYAGTDAPDVLDVPGCVIRVWPLGAAR